MGVLKRVLHIQRNHSSKTPTKNGRYKDDPHDPHDPRPHERLARHDASMHTVAPVMNDKCHQPHSHIIMVKSPLDYSPLRCSPAYQDTVSRREILYEDTKI